MRVLIEHQANALCLQNAESTAGPIAFIIFLIYRIEN